MKVAGRALTRQRTRRDIHVSVEGRIQGCSMMPLFTPGSRVQIVRCPLHEMRRGDVAVFRHENVLIGHRVVERIRQNRGWRLHTKADAGFGIDPAITQTRLIGKLTTLYWHGLSVPLDNAFARGLGLLSSGIMPYVARALFRLKHTFCCHVVLRYR